VTFARLSDAFIPTDSGSWLGCRRYGSTSTWPAD